MWRYRNHHALVSVRRKETTHRMNHSRPWTIIIGWLILLGSLILWSGSYYLMNTWWLFSSESIVMAEDYSSSTFQTTQQNNPKVGWTMKQWREQLTASCQTLVQRYPSIISLDQMFDQKERIESQALSYLTLPNMSQFSTWLDNHNNNNNNNNNHDSHVILMRQQQLHQQLNDCQHVFLDLGTNRGDSIAYAVDASVDVCSPLILQADPSLISQYRTNKSFPHPHFHVMDMTFHTKGYRAFGLLGTLQRLLGGQWDETCVYGMEGNPYFTQQLQRLEYVVQGMVPRPLKHVHIFTESVIAEQDQPTILYLDQYSTQDHVRNTRTYICVDRSQSGKVVAVVGSIFCFKYKSSLPVQPYHSMYFV